ncbi:MAG: outer membrane beta-barrel protein [Salinimicrobium sp.]
MNLRKILLFLGLLTVSIHADAQRIWEGSYNRFGLQGGVNQFNIQTNQLDINPGISWTAGFHSRASFYNDFQIVYGVNFYDFKLTMDGREKIENPEADREIEYNMIAVQINFFGSYKLLGHNLSLEAGPVVQVNGKLDARQDKEYWYLGNYDIQAINIEKISPINVNLAAGISGGFEQLKLWVQYQYGLNNMLKGLQDEGLQEIDPGVSKMKGHMSMLAGGIIVFL